MSFLEIVKIGLLIGGSLLSVAFYGAKYINNAVKTWRSMRRIFGHSQPKPHALGDAPRSTIREPNLDEVTRLEGRIVSAGKLFDSPLQKRKCVYYEVVVERFDEDIDNDWTLMAQHREVADFFIDDGTGRARVDTNAIEVETDFDVKLKGADLTKAQKRALVTCGIEKKKWFADGSVRWKERTLAPHETIAVCGVLKWEPDPSAPVNDGGYREGPRRLSVQAAPEGFVLVPDRPMLPAGYGDENAEA